MLRTLGDELISSETVAIIELVKNSYDADATRVAVRFQGALVPQKGSVEVIDNGHGMDLQTVRSAWMEPATLMKHRSPRSESGRRRVLGEKGIGRFASAKLGEKLELVTRRVGQHSEVRALFDWSQFDDEEKYLDQIEVQWIEGPASEICPGGTIQFMWRDGEVPDNEDLSHGTILRMEGLRSGWDRAEIEKLRTDLTRLISPYRWKSMEVERDAFQIWLDLPEPFSQLSGDVGPPESLSQPHYQVKGVVKENGEADLELAVRGKPGIKRVKKQFTLQRGGPPLCGAFAIELRVWDRDQSSMKDLAAERGSTLRDVRRDLDDVAGINIYRDGFRVLPYGEPRNDWLRLDLRRVQNPTLRLSNNQIVGFVQISADGNPALRDQSNREGLIEGPALDDLRTFVKMVLAELEQRRYDSRPRRQRNQMLGGLFAELDLGGVHEAIKLRHPEDTDLLEFVGEKGRDLERRIEGVQDVLSRYRRLATLGGLIDVVLHDGRAPLSKIGNEAHLGRRDAERAAQPSEELVRLFAQRFEVIEVQSGTLGTVFRRIEPFGGRKRGRPLEVVLESVIEDAFAVLETEIAAVGVIVELPKSITQVRVDPAEMQEVIINLLQNSLHWLKDVPKEKRAISVKISRGTEGEVQIIFSDSGPGVDTEFRDRIFDPYFSTKPDGVGLGLTIAGEIVSEYYGGTLELVDRGALPGTTFRIVLRRRV